MIVEVPPSPKSQFQETGELKDMSVNWTVIGAKPMLLLIMKKETGARPGTRGGTGVGVTVGDMVPDGDVGAGEGTTVGALTQT